jgi:oligogalacturonide lyase
MTNAAANGEHVYFGIWEDLSCRFEVDLLRGYVGFEETWAAKPLSKIMCVATDGSGSEPIFEEHYWIRGCYALPALSGLSSSLTGWDVRDTRVM